MKVHLLSGRAVLALVLLAPALASPVARSADSTPLGSVHVAFVEGRPFAEVIKRAKAEKKPILLDVVAEWCGPCKLMDRTTFADSAVVEFSKRTIPARFDAEKGEGRKIAQRYAVRSFPTVIFLDSDGNEIDRLLGAFGAVDFKKHGENILSGKGRLSEAYAKLKTDYSYDLAYSLLRSFAERNDLPRLRPIAIRIVTEDPDFNREETLETLTILAALEDLADKVSPETTDLIETYIPRLGNDSKRGVLSVVLAREMGRRGDVAGARATADQATKALGAETAYATDLQVAVGNAEKNAGQFAAAAATFKKAAASPHANRALQAYIQMSLAEALAGAGKPAEAKAALDESLKKAGEDPAALARAAKVALALKDPKDAVVKARKAVGLSRGEDAASQAALAQALAATGDSNGAAEAWRRAGEIDPQNEEVKKHLRSSKKTASKTS